MSPQNNIESRLPELEASEKEIQSPEKQKIAERFKLPDLEEADRKKEEKTKEGKTNEYAWVKTAKSARNFLSREILRTENVLSHLGDVREGTDLHREIQNAAKSLFERRKEKGETSTEKDDFLSAIEERKETELTRSEMLGKRWRRLEVLSSESKGSKDDELNERAVEKAEDSRKKGRELNPIECNDKAREEMLKELKKEIKEEGVKEEIKRREEDRIANLKLELRRVHNEMKGISDASGEGMNRETRKAFTKELYKKAQEIFKSLTSENLHEKADRGARDEAAVEGVKIITKKEYYSPENINRMKEKIQEARWLSNVSEGWDELPQSEKKKYKGGLPEFKDKLEEQRKNLAQQLEKNGIILSRDVFGELLRKGYRPQEIRVKGWFGKRIGIPTKFKGVALEWKIGGFKSYTEAAQSDFNKRVEKQAKDEMDRRFRNGADRFERRRNRKLVEMIDRIITSSELDFKGKKLEKPSFKDEPQPEQDSKGPKEMGESIVDRTTKEMDDKRRAKTTPEELADENKLYEMAEQLLKKKTEDMDMIDRKTAEWLATIKKENWPEEYKRETIRDFMILHLRQKERQRELDRKKQESQRRVQESEKELENTRQRVQREFQTKKQKAEEDLRKKLEDIRQEAQEKIQKIKSEPWWKFW